jgi:DNA invertase Pin-like site-specific DNA recombinase
MNTTQQSAVGYFRVSTKRQGESGLGLDGQVKAVGDYCKASGLALGKTFTEVESGKLAERPQLTAALAHCKRTGARLIVAKLDRLARNVHFLSGLMNSGVDFTAVDNPSANKLTIHILAAVAEAEAAAISQRTKTALDAAKRRGVLLGSARPDHWEGREDRRQAGAIAGGAASASLRTERARQAVADLLPIMRQGRAEGKTFAAIAGELNAAGHTTSTGKPWDAIGVIHCMKRFNKGR